jgi:hypothetical protein
VCNLGACSGTSLGSSGGGSAGGSAFGGGSAGGSAFGGGSAGGSAFGGGSAGGSAFGGGSAGGSAFGGGSAGGSGGSGGGVPSCNSSNCATGCCSGTTCIQAPSNGTNQTCGFGGLACATCGPGQTCNLVTLTCQGGSGGGATGGGGPGGGGPGGGGPGGGGPGGGGPGDDCFNVAPITLVGNAAVVTGSLQGLFNDTSVCSGGGPDGVYAVTLPQTGTLSAQVTTGGFVPRLNVRSSCASTATLACASSSLSTSASVTTPLLGAGTYFIWVDSSGASSGASFTLTVSFTPLGGTGGGGAGGGGTGPVMLPDAGTPPTVTATLGACAPVTPCSGNLQGTWFNTASCLSQSSPVFSFCPTSSWLSYSVTGIGRLDFIGSQMLQTGSGTGSFSLNVPQACLMSFFSSNCSQLGSTLALSCSSASSGRSGCDCSGAVNNPSPITSTFTWTDNGGGEITFDRGNGDLTVWQTCVIPGTPDVLLVTDQSGNNRVTYVRR